MDFAKIAKISLTTLMVTSALAGCSKKEPVVEQVQLEGGRYPAGDTLGMWDSITRNNCTDQAKDKYQDGKEFELLSFKVSPNPPRTSADGKYNEYDKVDCEVRVSF